MLSWRQPDTLRTVRLYPSNSQSVLLSKTSVKSASSCQSNQSSNLSSNSSSVLMVCRTPRLRPSNAKYPPGYREINSALVSSLNILRFLEWINCMSVCPPVLSMFCPVKVFFHDVFPYPRDKGLEGVACCTGCKAPWWNFLIHKQNWLDLTLE